MLGIIRVLTIDDNDVLQEHGRKMNEYLNINSITKCISDQPNGIYNDETEQIAIPKIIELAQEMRQQYKLNAITISCAADPGLDEIRSVLDIPVLGAGVSGAHVACMLGNRVGILGITETPPNRIKKELAHRFFSYSYSPSLRKTTDLFRDGAKEELLRVANELINSGADVILFACTGFSTIRLKDYFVHHIFKPIVDLVEAQAIAYKIIDNNERLSYKTVL